MRSVGNFVIFILGNHVSSVGPPCAVPHRSVGRNTQHQQRNNLQADATHLRIVLYCELPATHQVVVSQALRLEDKVFPIGKACNALRTREGSQNSPD